MLSKLSGGSTLAAVAAEDVQAAVCAECGRCRLERLGCRICPLLMADTKARLLGDAAPLAALEEADCGLGDKELALAPALGTVPVAFAVEDPGATDAALGATAARLRAVAGPCEVDVAATEEKSANPLDTPYVLEGTLPTLEALTATWASSQAELPNGTTTGCVGLSKGATADAAAACRSLR